MHASPKSRARVRILLTWFKVTNVNIGHKLFHFHFHIYFLTYSSCFEKKNEKLKLHNTSTTFQFVVLKLQDPNFGNGHARKIDVESRQAVIEEDKKLEQQLLNIITLVNVVLLDVDVEKLLYGEDVYDESKYV